jgi:histidyl-tRNA synthetase
MTDEIFKRLGIRVCIKINNRKILSGIAETISEADKIIDITIAIDKFDKIGQEKVNEELASKGITPEAIKQIQPILGLSGSNREKLNTLKTILKSSETGLQGIKEVETILDKIEITPLNSNLDLDLTLARGLNYYTGAIFEVKALDVEIGSISGGGRYDNLTGFFGMPGVSGVGISFGADRIFDVLNQLNLYPEKLTRQTQVLFINFGEQEENYILPVLIQLREKGICSEIYPEAVKLKKQLSYADSNQIPFVVMAGENERTTEKLTVKKMSNGEQTQCTAEELCKIVSF